MSLFLSASHKTKQNERNTNEKWKTWSLFYQSWIADTFLKSRAPKSIRRTTLLISAYLLLGNVSEPCWRLLQRLKIVVSKQVVEDWTKSNNKAIVSNDSMLIYVFDNCDIKVLMKPN